MSNATKTQAAARSKAERLYLHQINAVMKEAQEQLGKFDDPGEMISAFTQFFDSPYAQHKLRNAARSMATMLKVGQFNSWREAATESSQGRAINQALRKTMGTHVGNKVREIVETNSQLIKTVTGSAARKPSTVAQEAWIAGKRPEQIASEIKKIAPDASESRIRLLARTETSKAATALVEARSEDLGIEWYIWRSGQDERVRDAHAYMDGILCRWSDPPDPESLARKAGASKASSYGSYHPGNTFNCRCIPDPIIALADIKFPVKVHNAGKIDDYTKKEFYAEFYPNTEQEIQEEEANIPLESGSEVPAETATASLTVTPVPETTPTIEPSAPVIRHAGHPKLDGSTASKAEKVKSIMTRIPGYTKAQATEAVSQVEWWSGSGYAKIRKLGDEKSRKAASVIEEMLDRLPKFNGKLYRGVNLPTANINEQLKLILADKPINMQGITSWSSNQKTARGFASGSGKRIIYELEHSNRAASIRDISIYGSKEQEALAPGSVEYILNGTPRIIKSKGEEYTIIPLREV